MGSYLNVLKDIKRFLKTRLNLWLNKRIPPADKITLDHRRIFIFPNAYGFSYLIVVFILFLAGVNYQNNLLLAFCFLLISLFLNGILNTYRNLSGLTISNVGTVPVYAGEIAYFQVRVSRLDAGDIHSLKLAIPGQACQILTVDSQELNDESTQSQRVSLPCLTSRRGWYHAERIYLYSVFPFGLMRAWSWIDLNLKCLVYPRPLPYLFNEGSDDLPGQHAFNNVAGEEDFAGLRPYRTGDSPRQIAWKVLAKGGGLHSTLLTGQSGETQWIDWDNWPSLDFENRLSVMCYWAQIFFEQHRAFGMRLPTIEIPQGSGRIHFQTCLQTLALFETTKDA